MNPRNAQWIPVYAGMAKKNQPGSHGFLSVRVSPVIPAKAGIHKGAPVMK